VVQPRGRLGEQRAGLAIRDTASGSTEQQRAEQVCLLQSISDVAHVGQLIPSRISVEARYSGVGIVFEVPVKSRRVAFFDVVGGIPICVRRGRASIHL
jgi:hypothetical protein